MRDGIFFTIISLVHNFISSICDYNDTDWDVIDGVQWFVYWTFSIYYLHCLRNVLRSAEHFFEKYTAVETGGEPHDFAKNDTDSETDFDENEP